MSGTKASTFTLVVLVLWTMFNSENLRADGDVPVSKDAAVLTIRSDAQRYKRGASILMEAQFNSDQNPRIQLSDDHGGSEYFIMLVFERDSGKLVKCSPFSQLQFVALPRLRVRESWLHEVYYPESRMRVGLKRQLVAYGKKLEDLGSGNYDLRIAYGLRTAWIEELIKQQTGQPCSIPAAEVAVLEGAFDKPLLSDPIPITIE